jgi:tellurite resistance protein
VCRTRRPRQASEIRKPTLSKPFRKEYRRRVRIVTSGGEMAGEKNMALGAAFAVGGTLLTAATTSGPNGGGVIFIGAMVGGAIQFLIGLVQFMGTSRETYSPPVRHVAQPARPPAAEEPPDADLHLFVRSMIAVAAEDGELDDGEISIIRFISGSVLSEPLETQLIRDVFQQMRGRNYLDEIQTYANKVSPNVAELSVKSAVMVSLADGDPSDSERILVSAIAARLGIKGERLQQLADEANELYRRLTTEEEPEDEEQITGAEIPQPRPA